LDARRALETLDSSGPKTALSGTDRPSMFWRDKAGRGWYWESEDLGEHRLFSRSGDLVPKGAGPVGQPSPGSLIRKSCTRTCSDCPFGATALAGQQPVISVDTKKKELVGDFKNGGRE
jgi:hypothetical protein